MKKLLALSVASAALTGMAYAQDSADYPPDADAGSCFARVLIPETTEIQTESSEIKVIPAEYETTTEQVLVKEESVKYNVIPAEYETVTEQVVETPERTETVVIPAEYETTTEQVLVKEESVKYTRGVTLQRITYGH